MSRIQCPISRPAGQDSLTTSVRRAVGRRHTPRGKPALREKPTDKESGFESCPSSPRSDASVESGQTCQCGAQTELRHQAGDCTSLDCFSFIKKLGSGGYGSVVLVEKRRGRDQGARYALKISSLSRAALVERDILPRLRGLPYTTDLAYAFFTASPPRAFLALPYAIGRDLFSLAGPGKRPGYLRKMFVLAYPQYVERVRLILAELTVALHCLHENRILYRDLKLENILVSGDGHIRLADFGLSRHFEIGESAHITGKTGTPDYMAPEVIRSNGAHGPATQYSYEADMWGLGVIAYELIVGQLPFRGRQLIDLEHSILHDPVELPHSYVEEKLGVLLWHERPLVLSALNMVQTLLQRRPADRPTAAELPNHAFFAPLDWPAIASGRHDDPPFDIRRVVRELPADDSARRLPSAFSGVPSQKKERRDKGAGTGYDNPAKYKNYPYCSSELGWYDSDLELAVPADTRHLVPEGAVVEDDDAQWETEPGTPLDEVASLLTLPASPVSPDSACGAGQSREEETEDDEEGMEEEVEEEWVSSALLPPHPRSPSPIREDSDSDIEVIEVIAAPRGQKRHLSCQRRLDFDAADADWPTDALPPKKQRRFLQAAVERRVVVQTALPPLPPLPPFSSLQSPRPRPAGLH
ncbi:serine/threonine-protein kinase Sgk1-like [Amphibalanus amphitrite]|uniref:serine/threonine-protein kinase Sgk1-like n=1 Tax=Amphibalanus amphitrite TaxID=1232801 RepID=UPI001C908421|nr:serine/threonine-protein kinase Sgk1-like [Amphibalanus amphitrite]